MSKFVEFEGWMLSVDHIVAVGNVIEFLGRMEPAFGFEVYMTNPNAEYIVKTTRSRGDAESKRDEFIAKLENVR